MNEIYHYPFLCVGWFGLFVTALNLIPIGQLDGGHIIYALFGKSYNRIAQASLVVLVLLGTLGFLEEFGIPIHLGWEGWLFWAVILIVFLRSAKLRRPEPSDLSALDPKRKLVGWLCVVMFILCFSLTPIAIL